MVADRVDPPVPVAQMGSLIIAPAPALLPAPLFAPTGLVQNWGSGGNSGWRE
jgi:hypothetical protein